LTARGYDVLFAMPWAGSALDGSGPARGAETQMLAAARCLARAGGRVAVLVVGERSSLPDEVDGVRVLTVRPGPAARGLSGLVHDLRMFRAVVAARSAVVVQRNASRSVLVAALAARLSRGSFVYSSANVVDFDLGRIERWYNVRMFEWGVRAASQVVVQTDEQAAMCRSHFGRAPTVIRSIAERAEPRDGVPETFLWIGRMAHYKRLDVYLDLAAALPDVSFEAIVLSASDDEREREARLSETIDGLPNITLFDPRPRAQLGPLIERAVAIVNTSEYEGMPNVFLESWARGVPALAFSHDPDGVVTKYGLGSFAGGSRERFVELARVLWESRGDQRELAARCIAYVRRHHDSRVVCNAWQTVVDANRAS
jgi:glycosyltransferase involved in cell wall biosynthesis